MKKLLLLTFFVLTAYQISFSQCEGCVINTDCIADPPGPALCPEVLPAATQGEFYDADITFYLPNQFFEASAGVTITVSQLVISSVSGLPLGVSWQSNSANNTYQITADANTHRGCVKICGIPTFAGNFVISVNVVVTVTAPISTTANQSFTLPLIVNPGAGGNAGFVFNPTSGCDSVTSSFQGIITDDFRPVSYEWLINDSISLSGQDINYSFNNADTHQVVLTTTLFNYVMTSLTVTATTNEWCGDIEEAFLFGVCFGSPDLYFRLTNDGVTVQSPTVDNQLTANFNNLNFVITAPAISLSFWDEDLGPPLGSPDDFLGTAVVTINGTGSYNFSTPHTVGSFTIGTQVFVVQNDTDIVVVNSSPVAPLISWTGMPETEFCSGDPIVFSSDTTYFMQWYRDGNAIINANASSFSISNNHSVQLEIANESGCSSFSELVDISLNPLPPTPAVFYNAASNTLFTNIVPGFDLQWYFNGEPIEAANGTTHNPLQDGEYVLSASNEFGCTNFSIAYAHSTVGMTVIEDGDFAIYPNPASEGIFVQSKNAMSKPVVVSIIDMNGKIILQQQINNTNESTYLNIQDLSKGLYMVQIMNNQQMLYKTRFIKQ